MKLKSFIAKATVITILSGVVFGGAKFLYIDNEHAQINLDRIFNHDPVMINAPVKPAYGYNFGGSTCFKNTLSFRYPDFDTKEECERRVSDYMEQFRPLFKQELIYGRTMLASGAVLFLSLASIFLSLAFVGLRKLWKL